MGIRFENKTKNEKNYVWSEVWGDLTLEEIFEGDVKRVLDYGGKVRKVERNEWGRWVDITWMFKGWLKNQ